MKIVSKIIDINSENKTINIVLDSNSFVMGENQSMDKFADITANSLINPVKDMEMIKFKLGNNTSLKFNFFINNQFISSDLYSAYKNTQTDETNVPLSSILKSYFMVDLFDSTNVHSQTRISRNYITNLNTFLGITNGYQLTIGNPLQFNYTFLPKYLIEQKTNFNLHCKISFYDALNGKVINFINDRKKNLLSNDKLFFEISCDVNNRKWQFVEGNSIIANGYIGSTYSKKDTNAIQDKTQTNMSESYPAGNIFDYKTMDYKTII